MTDLEKTIRAAAERLTKEELVEIIVGFTQEVSEAKFKQNDDGYYNEQAIGHCYAAMRGLEELRTGKIRLDPEYINEVRKHFDGKKN